MGGETVRWGLAKFVARRVALAFSRPASVKTGPLIGSLGHVQITAPMLSKNGENTRINTLDLTARAIRLNNRHKGRARRYLDIHQALSKWSCSK